jgi:arsenate reductase
MKKIYYLGTCSTCNRIIKDLGGLKEFEFQDIKKAPITSRQIDEMKKMSGTYESLFSRRAMKYKSMGLKNVKLTEKDYRKLILEEYTFLKRPVIVFHDQIFVGNAKSVVEAARKAIL